MNKKRKAINKLLCLLLSIVVIFSSAACRYIDESDYMWVEPPPLDASGKLAIIEERMFFEGITRDSLSYHLFVRNHDRFGLESIDPAWGRGWTQEQFDEDITEYRHLLEMLAEIDIDDLNDPEDILLYKTLVQNLELHVRMGDFYYYQEPFHTSDGVYANAPLVLAEFEFRKQADIETYISLLRLFDEFIGQQLSFEREKAQTGLFMPDFILDMVVETCEGFLADRDGRHYLIVSFDHRIDEIEWLDEAQKRQYKEENEQVLREHFFPVYDNIITELSLLRGSGGTELSDMRKEHFLLLLQSNTSSNFSPEFIIELLDYELISMRNRIILALNQNPNVEVDYYNLALSKGTIEQNMDYLKSIGPTVFPELPPHSLSLEILPESLHFINAAAFYLTQPVDDYYSNIIRINPNTADNDPALMFILAHEGYGGHLLESVYSGHNGMGRLRRIISNVAFGEGFANYGAEQLLLASDFDEVYINFAIAVMMIDNYMGARAEIGIFYENWTTDDLSDMLFEFYGHRLDDDAVRDLYERTYASKHIFIRYGVGTAFFQNMRRSVERLGSVFNQMTYHTKLLNIGSVPLNVLGTTVEESFPLPIFPSCTEILIHRILRVAA